MGPDFLAILIIVAVLAGGTKPGRNFIREAWKATGWRPPRKAARHYSGRLGAAAGRAIAGRPRGGSGRSRSVRSGWSLAPAAHAVRMRAGQDGAKGLFRTRRGPLIPLIRVTDLKPGSPQAPAKAPAGKSAPPASAPAPEPRVCVACGNPEYGPRKDGGNWGPLVLYTEPIYGDGHPEAPRLIHKAHFKDEGSGFYGRPYQPAPAPADPGTGTVPAPPAPATVPPRRRNMTARYVINLETPTTDGEFLESAVKIADTLKALAEDIGNWAEGLGALNLPQSVLNPLHQVSEGITEAAQGASQAATNFEAEFEDAREVASRGLHFTGQDAA